MLGWPYVCKTEDNAVMEETFGTLPTAVVTWYLTTTFFWWQWMQHKSLPEWRNLYRWMCCHCISPYSGTITVSICLAIFGFTLAMDVANIPDGPIVELQWPIYTWRSLQLIPMATQSEGGHHISGVIRAQTGTSGSSLILEDKHGEGAKFVSMMTIMLTIHFLVNIHGPNLHVHHRLVWGSTATEAMSYSIITSIEALDDP